MDFYSVRKVDSETKRIAAVDTKGYELFLYVKNTRLFHRHRRFASELFFPDPRNDPTLVFEKITRAEAVELMKNSQPLNIRFSFPAKLLKEYQEQIGQPGEILTPAEVGLTE